MKPRTVKTLVGLGIGLLLAGCVTGERYSPTEIVTFPPKVQEQIKSGELSLGMSPTVVRYTWGSPNQIKLKGVDEEGRVHEEWSYHSGIAYQTRLVFKDNKLVGIISGMTNDESLLIDKKIKANEAPAPAATAPASTQPPMQPKAAPEAPKEPKP